MLEWKHSGAVVALRKLKWDRDRERLKALNLFLDRVIGKEYSIRGILARKGASDESDSYFCSELVAAAYLTLGILNPNPDHSGVILPRHFGVQSVNTLLLKDAELGEEIAVKFDEEDLASSTNMEEARLALVEAALATENARKKKEEWRARKLGGTSPLSRSSSAESGCCCGGDVCGDTACEYESKDEGGEDEEDGDGEGEGEEMNGESKRGGGSGKERNAAARSHNKISAILGLSSLPPPTSTRPHAMSTSNSTPQVGPMLSTTPTTRPRSNTQNIQGV